MPRSNADKRRAVMVLLNDPEWSGWSDNELGRRCSVSQSFVSKLRAEIAPLKAVISDPTPRTYTTKHGTTRDELRQIANLAATAAFAMLTFLGVPRGEMTSALPDGVA